MVRRATTWRDTFISSTIVADAAQTPIALSDVTVPKLEANDTVIRVLLMLQFCEAALNTAKAVISMNIGVGVTSQEAFSAGTTAMPDVNITVDKPRLGWLVRGELMVPSSGSDATRPVPVAVYERDIRAMRKVENGVLFLLLRSNTELGTGFSSFARGLVRCLFKLG